MPLRNQAIPTGTRFGRLVVIATTANRLRGARVYECRCDCGGLTLVVGDNLKRGRTQSCGCGQAVVVTHGLTRDPLYRTWRGMIARCYNPTATGYERYGGRGIEVCAEWRSTPAAFIADVSRLPRYGEPGRTIDRIDNDGNYEPDNVRWATAKEQAANRREELCH